MEVPKPTVISTMPVSQPEQKMATYLAGCLLKILTVEKCSECSYQLILTQLPSLHQELSRYEFIRNKTYQKADFLTYPTPKMANF